MPLPSAGAHFHVLQSHGNRYMFSLTVYVALVRSQFQKGCMVFKGVSGYGSDIDCDREVKDYQCIGSKMGESG